MNDSYETARPVFSRAAAQVEQQENAEREAAISSPLKQLADDARNEAVRRREEEAQRQRNGDAALADAVEVVRRQRVRLGRNVCSAHDGAAIRQIMVLLVGMAGADGGSDADPSFNQ